jgi:hypothetical protein
MDAVSFFFSSQAFLPFVRPFYHLGSRSSSISIHFLMKVEQLVAVSVAFSLLPPMFASLDAYYSR